MAGVRSPPNVFLPAPYDVNPSSVPYSQAPFPVDFLLPVVKDEEFLAAYSILENQVKAVPDPSLGFVYFGKVGDHVAAILRSAQGTGGQSGMQNTCLDAIKYLRPKAIICGGCCFALKDAELGDVIISERLTMYAPGFVDESGRTVWQGPKLECSVALFSMFKDAIFGWAPPGVTEGSSPAVLMGEMISGPQQVYSASMTAMFRERFPIALAGEVEGEGIYAACSRKDVEWIVVKSVAHSGDGGVARKEWLAYAALCSFSLIQKVLKAHPNWYGTSERQNFHLSDRNKPVTQSDDRSANFQTCTPGRSYSIKSGQPSSDDLLSIAQEITSKWQRVGRALGLPQPTLDQIDIDYRGDVYEQGYQTLRKWLQSKGSTATYAELAGALTHQTVQLNHVSFKYCQQL